MQNPLLAGKATRSMRIYGGELSFQPTPVRENQRRATAQRRGPLRAIRLGSFGIGQGRFDATAALFWALVGLPVAWVVWITLKNAMHFLM